MLKVAMDIWPKQETDIWCKCQESFYESLRAVSKAAVYFCIF